MQPSSTLILTQLNSDAQKTGAGRLLRSPLSAPAPATAARKLGAKWSQICIGWVRGRGSPRSAATMIDAFPDFLYTASCYATS